MALKRPKLAEVDQPRALTAATADVSLAEGSSWKTWKFGNAAWQAESWRLYDIVPEHHFLAGRIGATVAQARLYVAEVDETGEEQGETTNPEIARLAALPLGSGAQRDDALRLAGIDLAAAGECWVVGEGAAKDPLNTENSWFVVTASAIRKQGGRLIVKRPKIRGGGDLVLENKVDVLSRCWLPHPNDPDQADSPARPAIVPLREIELLTKREFAELDSRLTGAGVWFLPEGVDFPRNPEDPPGITGFMAYMQRAAAASMKDQSTAQAMVPIMATLPAEAMQYLADMKPINFWSELSAEIAPMKEKAIHRLASSYELPNEVMEGIGSANHWTAWLISEEGIRWIKQYLAPIAETLTRCSLRLALAKMGVPNPERYVFAWDTSTLAAKPNRIEDALRLHELNLLSDVETVKAGAFDPEQMPSGEELVRQRLWKVVMVQPDLLRDPAVQAALGMPAIESVGLPPTAAQNTDGDPDDDPSERRGVPDDEGMPDALTAALSARVSALTTAPVPRWTRQFEAACKLMVLRALELAGGRMTTPQERRQRWADVPRYQLNARVGPLVPGRAERMLEGAWSHLPEVAEDLGVGAGALQELLDGYCRELLVRGVPHSDDLLFAALSVANRGRGLPIEGAA